MNRNALNALVREINLGVDALKALSDRQVTEISSWRERPTDDVAHRYARQEAVRLATAVREADRLLKENKNELAALDEEPAPGFQAQPGLGPVSVEAVLVAYSYRGRIRSETAFAAMAGVAPLQASSGKTVRHRLNRHEDRGLNHALDVIAKVRMNFHEETKLFVEKRTGMGSSYQENHKALPCSQRFPSVAGTHGLTQVIKGSVKPRSLTNQQSQECCRSDEQDTA